jgi:hypothetical protein
MWKQRSRALLLSSTGWARQERQTVQQEEESTKHEAFSADVTGLKAPPSFTSYSSRVSATFVRADLHLQKTPQPGIPHLS